MEITQLILAAFVWIAAGYLTWQNRQHEKHMRQILEHMEKERKLYEIISNVTTDKMVEALQRTHGAKDDD